MIDNSMLQIIATLAGTALTGYIAYKMAQLKSNSELAIRLADEAAHKVDKITETTEKTLVHVNDQFLIQLRLYMESTRIIAELRKNPSDIEKANAAEKMYKEHEAGQAVARADKNAIDAVKAVASASVLDKGIVI